MKTLRLVTLAIALVLAGAAAAQGFPNYYPKDGFQRVGTIDSVQAEEQRLIIGDLAYSMSSNLIIHSPRAYSVPQSNLRAGGKIGFKLVRGDERMITEIWLLPDDYAGGDSRQRRVR